MIRFGGSSLARTRKLPGIPGFGIVRKESNPIGDFLPDVRELVLE